MSRLFATINWAKDSNIYEVNMRQYTTEGTFLAFRKHLPRLQEMGIKILWLMPVTPISREMRLGELGSYYACSSYTAVNPEYGELDDFKGLVDEAHELGLKVIIDWVANHTGYGHHWVVEHPDWYLKDARGNFTEVNGWTDVIDLDYKVEEMRAGMIAAMKFWVSDYDIDGFRCDMAHLMPLDFWKVARMECDAVKPLFWLAECEVINYHDVFDVTYAWTWMHETEEYIHGHGSLNRVRNVLHDYSQYPQDTQKLFFTSNHDENTWNGTEYEKYGNAAKALAVFTCTWKGMPLIYSGQELPNNKRLKFFDKDCIEWNDRILLKEFYTTLLKLHQLQAISAGETFILPVENDEVMAFLRRKEEEIVLVLLNLSGRNKLNITVKHEWLQGMFTNAFSGLSFEFKGEENFELQQFEYIVYTK